MVVIKIAVYRCAPNGEFIRHLNPSLNLSNIHSICFGSSGHLIVGNYWGSSGVYVFQPSGEHVASLSLASSGGIQFPVGIATVNPERITSVIFNDFINPATLTSLYDNDFSRVLHAHAHNVAH